VSADAGPLPIPLADLMAPWPVVQNRGTEWMYRARATLIELLEQTGRIREASVWEQHSARLARLAEIESILAERMHRTLHELPVLDRPPLGDQPDRAEDRR
jgi:leucyl aminopeptidase (aminopeptidase T)